MVDAEVGESRVRVSDDADCRDGAERGVDVLRCDGVVERRLPSETTAHTTITRRTSPSRSRPRLTIHSDVSSLYSTAEAAAKQPARMRPTGVASTKPAFFPAMNTVGVASVEPEEARAHDEREPDQEQARVTPPRPR